MKIQKTAAAFLLFFLLWTHTAFANTCDFVADGTTRNWSASTSWNNCGGVAPTAADDVVFVSNTVLSTLTIDGTSGAPNLCRSFNTTGYTRTIAQAAGKYLQIGDGTTGHLLLTSGITYTPSATSRINFVSTATGNQITTAGKRMGPLFFDGVGGAWQLQDALDSVGSAIGVYLEQGALDLNSQNVAATSGTSFQRVGTATASLTTGTMTWKSGNGYWDATPSTGLTVSAAGMTYNNSGAAAIEWFYGGGFTYGTLTSTALTTGNFTITGTNTFGTLTLRTASGASQVTAGYLFEAGATQTVTGTFTGSGYATTTRAFLRSTVPGTPATINAATVVSTHADYRDITGAGAGEWNFSGLTTTANGDGGGNTGITFTAPKNCYMKTAVSVNWSGANWYSDSSPRTTACVPAVPLLHDTAIFDANSVTAGSKTITFDLATRLPAMNWTGVANTPAFAHSAVAIEQYGSVTLSSGMTHTGTGTVTFAGPGSVTLDGGTLTWPISSTILPDLASGTLSLSRDFTSAAGLTLTSGTFAQGVYNATFTAATINGGTHTGSGTYTGTTYAMPGGVSSVTGLVTLTGAFNTTGGTLNISPAGVTGNTTFTCSQTGIVNLAGQINASGAIAIAGGTLNDTGAAGELKGTTLAFTGGTSAIRKATMTSTIAISSAANVTFNPGTYTHVGEMKVVQGATSPVWTINGTAVDTGGVMTVTAAGGGGLSANPFGGFFH